MELLNYLNTHFLSEQAILKEANITFETLEHYQSLGIMPKASYRLNVTLHCDSFFGSKDDTQHLRFYATGYVSWLKLVGALFASSVMDPDMNHKDEVYAVFMVRYTQTINKLKGLGHTSNSPKINSGLHQHIEQEWIHFLDGTYGLCTLSGLPEDIAAKEFAIIEINELSLLGTLTVPQTVQLTRAVNLLDDASALFAPHERERSTRQRLVNDMREKYQLSA
ncbi:DUF6058 family natural product biosynthesis protein [Shewanella surugensis]|uniref:DUF6058 family natural product biosynthesis protein n=1 Tax=Shewanella surugensis TaxID=212020 RepID=A0ABT0L9W0_9GAMM|nr:DUF6058 family natural product biosynthesis protein [Shewanella surugensis]MCL1124469.1 DUF6058 family natural product biosynthesis protein [Shewanella surugensis]